MLNQFPQLLLADRFAPITNQILLFDLPLEQALEAYLEWQSRIWKKHATITSRPVTGDLEAILHQLEPMRTGQTNREILVPTSANWTALFNNCDTGPDLVGAMHVVSDNTGCQALRITINQWDFDGVRREAVFLDSMAFELYGPIKRGLMAWINDSDRWAFDTWGAPQPFERTDVYSRRRIRDRLSIELIAEYAAELGLRPFDHDFYAPDRIAALVELDWSSRGHPVRDVSLSQVQARLARGWHNPSSYEGII
jgi:hypothetical protein